MSRRRDDEPDPIDVTGPATMYPQHAGWRGDLQPVEIPAWVTESTDEHAVWPTPAEPTEPTAVDRMRCNRGFRFRLWFGRGL